MQLERGYDLFGDRAFGNGDDFDADAAKVAWELLRDTLLPRWIKERPGTRPAAWWLFDAPDPKRRERVDGGVHPFDDKKRALDVARSDHPALWRAAYRLMFGLPAAFIMPFDRDLKEESYEPEWSYLVRHKLLTPEDSP